MSGPKVTTPQEDTKKNKEVNKTKCEARNLSGSKEFSNQENKWGPFRAETRNRKWEASNLSGSKDCSLPSSRYDSSPRLPIDACFRVPDQYRF